MLKIKSIKPMHTKLVTTAERYEENDTANGLILKTVVLKNIRRLQPQVLWLEILRQEIL